MPLLSHDPTIKCDYQEMCKRLGANLAQFVCPRKSDSISGDWQLFRQILEANGHPLSHNIRRRNVMGGCAQRQVMQELFDTHRWPAHHSPNDARVLMMAMSKRICDASDLAESVENSVISALCGCYIIPEVPARSGNSLCPNECHRNDCRIRNLLLSQFTLLGQSSLREPCRMKSASGEEAGFPRQRRQHLPLVNS